MSSTTSSHAGGYIFDNYFAFAWEVGMPTGDNKFLSDFSFAGGTIEYRHMMSSHLSIGMDVSWNSYKEYFPYKTFKLSNNTDVTTDLYKF
jgi:hypothetical protein